MKGSSDNESASSICTSSTDVDIPEAITVNAENILAFSGVSPVKTKGLNERQREKKGKDKFQKCIATIQMHLEQSYRIELPVQIDDRLQMYENLMDQLVEEFSKADNKRKLQILTLSPYTIEKTVEKFNTTNWMVKKAEN
ncbi:unnamed protein product [Meganyctiphanes norvegica]|uniref:Uncharacterized protein n=1 Tax=Meganyctiphanes norvegica TaxID=48144 RepID=A0AAV2SFS2_MEGNR